MLKFVSLFLLILLANPIYSEWTDRFGPPTQTTLSNILKNPHSWLEVPVQIQVRFSRIGGIYNPVFSQFSEEQYINFFAWDIQADIWNEKGFKNEYPFFYVEKSNPEIKFFFRTKKFDTLTLYGKVTSIFRNTPYFSIGWACKLPGNLNVYNLKLLHQGMKAFKSRDFQTAENYFQTIFTTHPPHDIVLMLHKTIAKIDMYERHDFSRALQRLEVVKELYPKDNELKSLYSLCKYYCDNSRFQSIPEPSNQDIILEDKFIHRKVPKEESK